MFIARRAGSNHTLTSQKSDATGTVTELSRTISVRGNRPAILPGAPNVAAHPQHPGTRGYRQISTCQPRAANRTKNYCSVLQRTLIQKPGGGRKSWPGTSNPSAFRPEPTQADNRSEANQNRNRNRRAVRSCGRFAHNTKTRGHAKENNNTGGGQRGMSRTKKNESIQKTNVPRTRGGAHWIWATIYQFNETRANEKEIEDWAKQHDFMIQ